MKRRKLWLLPVVFAVLMFSLSACAAEPAVSDVGASSVENISASESIEDYGGVGCEMKPMFHSEAEFREMIGEGEKEWRIHGLTELYNSIQSYYYRLKNPVGEYTVCGNIEVDLFSTCQRVDPGELISWIYRKEGASGDANMIVFSQYLEKFSAKDVKQVHGLAHIEDGMYYAREIVPPDAHHPTAAIWQHIGFFADDGTFFKISVKNDDIWDFESLKPYCQVEKVSSR